MQVSDNKHLIERFEKLIRTKEIGFFDVEEFEEITDHYMDIGQLNSAKQAIDMGLNLYPNAPIFAVKTARYFVEANMVEQARKALEHAEGVAPNHPELEWTRGLIMVRMGKHKEAIKSLKLALDHVEDRYPILGQLAALYNAMGLYPEAIESIADMLTEEPDDEHLLYLLALITT